MTSHFLRSTSFIAVSAFFAGPALADVTAEEVWQNWQALGTSYGQTYSAGSQTRSGDTLTITDLTMDMSSGDNKTIGTIPEVIFRETGDGRVEITMSDAYRLTMNSKDGMNKDLSNTVIISQNGLRLTASGTAAAISYDIAADAIIVKMLDFLVDGKPKDMDIDLDLADLKATYQVAPGDMMAVNSTIAAQSLSFHVSGKDEEKNGTFDAKGQMNNIAGASAGAIPKAATGDLGAVLARGFTSDGSFTYDNGNFTLAAVSPDGTTTNLDSMSKGGSLNISMDKDRLAYGIHGKDVAVKVSGTAIPFPEVTAAYKEASFSLLAPISAGEEAKDFAVNVKLDGLTVSDAIWGMIDPGATLPRDPATLDIALKGKAKPLVDLLGADKAAMMGGHPPLQLHALDIEALQLTVAGAEFKGNGALTFDNNKPPVLGGVAPMPTGKVNLSLTGANTLLGKLQALGMVDQQITMTFGMMAGMLAKPGPTPDSYAAEVEITKDGKILSNGNPLPF
jgi:hypothetical protein